MYTLWPKYVLKSTIFIKVLHSDAKYEDTSLCLLKQHFIIGRKLFKSESFESPLGTEPLIKILLTIMDSLTQQ